MKSSTLIIGTFAFTLSLTACQNKATKSEGDLATRTDSSSTMDSMAMGEHSMSEPMDNMMKEMHQIQMTGNVDNDFAMMMKSHHQGAVQMSQKELTSGMDTAVKKMAQKIIDQQTAEINELQSFLDSHKNPEKNYDPAKKDAGFAGAMNQNMSMMMNIPKIHPDSSVDRQYVKMMLSHHESGVDMAEGFVQHGKNSGLLSMAKKMIADQKKEIEEFEKWDNSH